MQTDELTKTNCPTCGAECTVEGKTTHYYVPTLARYREKLLEWVERQLMQEHDGGEWDAAWDAAIRHVKRAIESGELMK